MSAEYPTLNISTPIDSIKETVNKITDDFSGELEEENNAFKLKVKFDQILNDEQLDSKLNFAASAQCPTKGFMLVWLAGFLTILAILALVSAKFRSGDADKNEVYYKSLSAKIAQVESSNTQDNEIINFRKLQESGLQEVAENRIVVKRTLMISGSLVSTGVLLLLFAYRSKINRKKSILILKGELLKKYSENGKNPNLDSREEVCEFRLFDSEDSTEFIFEDEEGSVLLAYLVGLVVAATFSREASTIYKGNEPLEEMISKYKDREIPTITLDKSILNKIDFD